jgi:hypothetical protein
MFYLSFLKFYLKNILYKFILMSCLSVLNIVSILE